MKTTFGKFVAKLRIDHSETQLDMAKKLGVTASYLSAVELGKREVPPEWIHSLSSLYELTPSQKVELFSFVKFDISTPAEREVLRIASTAIHLDDSSDYINALWDIIRVFIDIDLFDDDFTISTLYKHISKEEAHE